MSVPVVRPARHGAGRRSSPRFLFTRRKAFLALGACLAGLLLLTAGPCRGWRGRSRPVSDRPADPSLVLVTGYCNCGTCCSWRRSWFGFGPPVYAAGPLKGRPKRVGVTASGTKARKGTVAADPDVWKFGTRLSVPGYGEGVVEDLGGAIRGRHIDVWFPTHAEARRWGRRWLRVTERRP